MNERRLQGEADEQWWRARAAQDARLREAEWLDHDPWAEADNEPRPRRAPYRPPVTPAALPSLDREARRPPRNYTHESESRNPRYLSPTERSDSAWEYRARHITTYSTIEVPVSPIKAPIVAPSPLKPRRRRPSVRRWLARRWGAGPASRALLVTLLTTLLFICCAPGVVLVRAGFAASDGYQQLTQIENLINQDGVTALINPANQTFLQDHLTAAHNDFVVLDQILTAGRPLVALQGGLQNIARLVRMAVDLTGAGQQLLAVVTSTLAPLLSNPFSNNTGAILSPSILSAAHAQLAQAQAELTAAAAIAPTITDTGLPASLSPHGKLGPLLARIGDAAQVSQYFGVMLDDAPALLGVGTPATYLLLAMDRSELRTGGGFIGNYGILTVKGAHLQQTNMQDTYVLDAAYFARYHQEPPAQYPWWPYKYASTTYGWGMRDSNLSPDFPTDASAALHFVNAVQNDSQLRDPYPLVGVVGITSVVMGQIITIDGGALKLPEYPDHTITPQNLDDTIHCFQLGACRNETPILPAGQAQSTDRKQFTAFLGQTLVDQVRHFSGTQLKSLMKMVFQDFASKDIQFYLSEPHAETALMNAHLASNVPNQTGDSLLVTDTNIGGNKANAYVTQQEEDIVTLLPNGDALHHLLIHTSYRRQGPLYEGSTGQTSYWDYRRVYFPTTATYLGDAGFVNGSGRHLLNYTTTSDVPHRAMIGASLSLDDGSALGQCQPFAGQPVTQPWDCAAQNRDTYLYWLTPNAWHWQQGKAVYTLLAQRQAGSTVTLTVRIDTSQIHASGTPLLNVKSIVQSYDVPSTQAPTGYTGTPDATWATFGKRSSTIFHGPLAQDESLTWTGG